MSTSISGASGGSGPFAESGGEVTEQGMHRVGALCRYPALLEDVGADPALVFRRAGLSLADVASPDQIISFAGFGRLLLAGRELTGLEHIGAMAGRRASLDHLGPVGQLMRHAPTLGVAIADLVRNQPRYIRGAAVYTVVTGHRLTLGYAVHQPSTPGLQLIWDAVAAAGKSYFAELGAQPSRIEAMLPRPRPEKPAIWHHVLGPNLHFDARHDGVALTLSDLSHPVPGADPDIRRACEAQVRSYFVAQWPDLAGRLEREIRVRLMTGQAVSRDMLAAWAGLGPRSLNRQLSAEATSFKDILTRARREMAMQLLSGTRLSLDQISRALGYSEQSAFARAFREWSGFSASEWRKYARLSPGTP